MSHGQILPLPSTVEDTMDNVVLIPYNRPESGFNFEGWQEAPQCGQLSILPRLPLSVAAAPSTDSSPEAVIHSLPLQFQAQRRKGKPLYEVRAPPKATQNSRAYELNYSNYHKKRKPLSYKSKSFKPSRQPTPGCFNALLPKCRIQSTHLLYIRQSYLAALVVN